MANAVYEYLVAADLKNRTMRRFVAKSKMEFANHLVERNALSSNIEAFGMIGQRSESLLKSVQPTKCLFRRAMLTPPKCLLQELTLGARQDRHAVIQSLESICRRMSATASDNGSPRPSS